MSITNKIQLRNLQGNIFGGITAIVIARSMALIFTLNFDAEASRRLREAILIGCFSAVFCETSNLISEAIDPITALIASFTVNY